ncbi:hypothetical protein [Kordiimonas gwangyangensis]|uniref:hypothetical protein n=1 Tax=Kordiimonas gwangyangensis TaxID=288022 RepID=UPI000377B3BD|nr:hypothetical protein [Kordiimonas gwangyangensis]
MDMTSTIIGLVACAALWVFGYWREKRQVMGIVPLIPPFYIQFAALVGVFVFAAHLIALLTGVEWKPPFMR